MFKRETYWRNIAAVQAAEIEMLKAALDLAQGHLAGIELRTANMATLISITREQRTNNFTFVRGGQLIRITTMGQWGDNFAQWKKELFE